MKLITLLTCLTILSGCSSFKVSDDFAFGPNSREGIIVVSTRSDDKCRGFSNSSSITFTGKEKPFGLFLENSFIPNDFNNPPGYFNIQKVAAGTYKLQSLHKTGVMTGILDLSKYNISVVIKPGKIHYLGELHVDVPDCNSVKLKVKDHRVRDKKLFDKKMIKLKSSDFEYQLLRSSKRK